MDAKSDRRGYCEGPLYRLNVSLAFRNVAAAIEVARADAEFARFMATVGWPRGTALALRRSLPDPRP